MSGLAVTAATLDGVRVGLRSADGRIVALGEGVEPEPDDELIDGAGLALIPGFVNGHTHAAMTLFRGFADDLPLMEWLNEHIWPVEARLVADDVYWGTRLACVEMIRSGTVRFWDMYWQPGATARAVTDAGLRATIGAPLIDGGDPGSSARLEADAESGLAELAEAGLGERTAAALAPHAVYTVSEPSLRWIAERSAADALPIHVHLSETETEVRDCVAAHGVRPAEHLDRCGLLGPRTLLAHGVWLDDHERELIAASGATVVSSPTANMKLAVGGFFDLPAARELGIPIGLGTDGAGSNNALDMLAECKQLALVQKQRARDPAAVTAGEALAIARGGRAPLLGATPLAVGEPADFLLVRTETPALALGELDAGLAYAADPGVVVATVVGGRVLMRDGVVEGEQEIIARARERAERLGLA